MVPFDRLRVGEDETAWQSPLRLQVIGTAAARTLGCVVDYAGEPWEAEFPPGRAVLVAGDTLSPVATPGQWALLADEGEVAAGGDLVAARDRAGNRDLRRAWPVGDLWLLEAVNPLADVAPAVVPKGECVVQKLTGVAYEPVKEASPGSGRLVNEWLPRRDFKADWLTGCHGIKVYGSSLDPLAFEGQTVLVDHKTGSQLDEVRRGILAVVETTDDAVGSVVKRVFRQDKIWLLVSPNPIHPHDPIAVVTRKILSVRPVRGVLFDLCDREPSERPVE